MFTDHTNGKIRSFKSLTLFVDGGCEPKNPGGTSTAGWVLYNNAVLGVDNSNKLLVEEGRVAKDGGPLATNNFGEYSALCFSLKWLVEQNWRGNLDVFADSKLLVEQVNRNWKCNKTHLSEMRDKIWNYLELLEMKNLKAPFEVENKHRNLFSLTWVPRDQNAYANDLCRAAFQEYKKA